MELKLQLEFSQILNIIKQLPPAKKNELIAELSENRLSSKERANSRMQELLLHGPVMNDSEYSAYKEVRKKLNQWRAI